MYFITAVRYDRARARTKVSKGDVSWFDLTICWEFGEFHPVIPFIPRRIIHMPIINRIDILFCTPAAGLTWTVLINVQLFGFPFLNRRMVLRVSRKSRPINEA